MTIFTSRRGALTFYGVGVIILLLIGFTMSVGTGVLMLMTALFAASWNTWTMRGEPLKTKTTKAPAKKAAGKKAATPRKAQRAS